MSDPKEPENRPDAEEPLQRGVDKEETQGREKGPTD